MSDSKVIRLHVGATEIPLSTDARDVPAKVVPLRAVNDRRGKYKELRAFIDAGLDIEVSVETIH
jgi:hypothetical protein